MKNGTPLLKTLLVAAAAMSFCAAPAWAEDDENTITLSDGETKIASDAGTTTWAGNTFVISSSILTAENWGEDGYKGAWIAWSGVPVYTPALGTSTDNVTITGSGFLGLAFQNGNGNTASTVDLTNVNASEFAGQLAVVNAWADSVTVKLSGDWSGTEYIFGSVTAEWAGTTSISNGNFNTTDAENGLFTRGTSATNGHIKDEDILALQGNTTLAGVTGTSKDYSVGGINLASEDYITVNSTGTTLTIAGSGTYAFYGTVGADASSNVTRASIVMNSSDVSGKQTFGGTNYLQDVTVTAGTLALEGVTNIAGSVSVAESSTLELGGEITLSNTITNSGTVSIDDGTTFVLDNLTGGYYQDGIGYYELVSGGTISYSESGTFSFINDGSTLSGWELGTYGDSLYAYGIVGAYEWVGTSDNNNWSSSDANWIIDGDTSKTKVAFKEGTDVAFTEITDGISSTVNITENLKVGSITVEDNYTFTTSVDGGVVVDTDNALTVAEGKTLTIGEGVTLYIDFVESGFSVDGKIAGTGTLEIDLNSDYSSTINLGTDNEFAGTVYIHSGDFTLNNSNIGNGTYELAGSVNMQVTASTAITVENDFIIDGATDLHCNTNGGASSLTLTGSLTGKGTLTLAAGSGNALTISGDVDLGGLTIKTSATVTLNTYTDVTTGVTTGTNQKIGTVTFSSAGTLAIGDGVTLTVGTVTGSTAGSTISVGEGSVLNVTNGITYSTGNAASTASKITGAGADTSTVITGSLQIGSGNGASVQISDVTFITGGISYGSNSSLNFYLFFKDATLGFTESTTISPASSGGYGFMLGEFNGFSTTTDASTTTINTSKYDTTTNKFSDTDGVNVTIGANITGTYATLAVEGNGSLTLSGTTQVSGLTLSSGELNIAGTTSVSSGLTVSGGTLSVSEDATLNLSGTISLATSIENSGTITIAEGTSFVIDGIEMGTKGNDGANYYVIIDGSSGWGSVSFSGSISDFTLSSGKNLDGWSVYVDDGYLVIHNGEPPQGLIWAGTNDEHVWNADKSNTIWTNDGGDSVAFSTDSNVTFDDTAENKSVVLGDDIEAGTITVTGTGYEFSGEYKLTATELILADTDSGDDHTFTIAENTTVEVGQLAEEVGQMNFVVNGFLNVTESMHIDSSENEVISGSGRIEVKNFTYDAAQGSSLTITVGEFSFSDFVEKPSGEDDANSGAYRTLIIGSEDGVVPGDAWYSTEVSGAYAEISGKSEVRVNQNSMFAALSIHNYSDYDLLISGEGLFYANEFDLAGKGTLIISCAEVEAGVVYNSKENIVINKGGQLAVGDFEHTTIVEDDGEVYTEGLLNLQVDGTFIVDVLEDYVAPTGTLSFGSEDSDTELEGSHSISGSGTANIYKLEYGADGAGLEISVANLNIGEGGISAAEGASSLVLNGVTVGVYAGLDEENTNTSWSTKANLTLKNGVTFNTEAGESITLAGVVETDGEGSSLTKTGEGDLILAGKATLSGLTVSAGTLSVATDASLALSGEVTLATAISNSGSITIDSDTSFVIDGIGSVLDLEREKVYYVVVEGSNGAELTYEVNDGSNFTVGSSTLAGWNVYTTDGYLVIYRDADMTLIWDGTSDNFVWNKESTNTDWKVEDTTNTYFFDGANVIFDTIGDSGISSEVKIVENITAGTITVNDNYSFATEVTDGVVVKTSGLEFGENGKLTIGNDVTVQIVGGEPLSGFSVGGTIVGTGTLQLELSDNDYSATVNLGAENEFAGTVYITAGNFTLNGSDIGNGTFRLADGVNMQVNSSGTEVGNNFIFEGTSEVHINANDSLTINGSVTGVETDGVMGGTFDRQGAGSLEIAGNVNIGTFIIDTSGSDAVSETTFSGESVTIGKLDVEYADSVVFSNDNGSVTISEIDFVQAGTIEFANGGTVGKIDLSTANGAGTIIVSGGTLDVGTIENTFTNTAHATTLEVAEGAVLHAEKIDIAPGSAGSVYSTISGTEEGSGGTVIADSFIVGAEASTSGGTSIEVSDVTLIVGALSFGNGENSNLNLYLNNATLGFSGDAEIKSTEEGSGSTSRFVLGGFASGNSTATGSGTTTTINTSRYDVDSGDFTSAGVTVTISQIISGQGELAVDGVGKLILSAANTYSGGTTIASGATVVAQDGSALGSGNVTVNSGATLELDTHVTVDTTSSNVTFAVGASIVLGGSLLDSILDSADTGEAVAVITANTITFGDVSVSGYTSDSDGLSEIVNQYVTSGTRYGITWSWDGNTLWAVASIPEPSMFGVLLGISALALTATRRRRRRQYREAA